MLGRRNLQFFKDAGSIIERSCYSAFVKRKTRDISLVYAPSIFFHSPQARVHCTGLWSNQDMQSLEGIEQYDQINLSETAIMVKCDADQAKQYKIQIRTSFAQCHLPIKGVVVVIKATRLFIP